MVSRKHFNQKISKNQRIKELSNNTLLRNRVVTEPQIIEFDFQTEDYSVPIEEEMKWMYDKERLEEHKDFGYSTELIISHTKSDTNSIKIRKYKKKSRNKINSESDHSNTYKQNQSQNQLKTNSYRPLKRKLKQKNKKEFHSSLDFTENKIFEQFLQNMSLNDSNKTQLFSNNEKPLLDESSTQSKEGSHRPISRTVIQSEPIRKGEEWKRVVDKNGNSIERRVITLPQQINRVVEGHHPMRTEAEELVITEKLKTVVKVEEI